MGDSCIRPCPEGTIAVGDTCEPPGPGSLPGDCPSGEEYDSAGAEGAEIFVHQAQGSVAGSGTEQDPVQTLEQALGLIQSTDEVVSMIVGPGEYDLPDAVDLPLESLMIFGKCAAETVLWRETQ